MVRVKFGDCIPFPDKQGVWIRLVMADSPEKEQSVVITQGHVMLFQQDKVIILDKGQETTPEVILNGDQLCQKEGLVVAYTAITGVGITKRKPMQNGHAPGLIVPGGDSDQSTPQGQGG